MVTPMTAIPVLFHREIESQTVEFESVRLGSLFVGTVWVIVCESGVCM